MCSVKMCPLEKNSFAHAKSTGINTAIGADLRFKGIDLLLLTPCDPRDPQDPRSTSWWCCKRHCHKCAYVGCSRLSQHREKSTDIRIRRSRGKIPI